MNPYLVNGQNALYIDRPQLNRFFVIVWAQFNLFFVIVYY